mmetsp:Transcript_17155/g.57963  ORF Transcript_17155/g.57963 Transcript_17155/m.57963 type:complete len:246 (-) Transcript_17155:466-1203(-)
MVRSHVATEHDRVAQSAVVRGHVDLGAQAPQSALAGVHGLEALQVEGDALVAVFRVGPRLARELHLLLRRVVHEPKAVGDELSGEGGDDVEVVRSVRQRDVAPFLASVLHRDAQHLQVLEDVVRVLLLFLGRVGVVKTDEEFALVPARVVVVEEDGLCVADVEVARRFRREARHDLSFNGALEGGAAALVGRRRRGLLLGRDGRGELGLGQRLEDGGNELAPPRRVRGQLLLIQQSGPDGRVGEG